MSHVDDGVLHAYLDGELSPALRERLDAHVAECSACRARLEEERGLIERASQLLGFAQPPERAAPPPLHQLRQPRLLWRIRMPLAWAATVTVALGLGYYLGESTLTAPREQDAPQATAAPLADSSTPRVDDAQQLATRVPRRNVRAEPPAEKEAKVESVGMESGVVAIRSQPELRDVAPAPAPAAPPVAAQESLRLRAAVVENPEAGRSALRGRAVATEWPLIQAGSARRMLGAALVGIPGLPVRDVRRSPAGDGVVLVQQQLDSATVIQLFQRRVDNTASVAGEVSRAAAPAAAPTPAPAPARAFDRVEAPTATERLARFIGGLRVEIAGPLSPDSLNKLLDKLEPIP